MSVENLLLFSIPKIDLLHTARKLQLIQATAGAAAGAEGADSD